MDTNLPIELYTDGSSLGNPGPSGLGYVIRFWHNENEDSMPKVKKYTGNQGFRLSTNNRMEIMAGIYGLKDIIGRIENKEFNGKIISLTSDSKYFIDAINKRWIDKWPQNGWVTATKFPVKNKDLWKQVIEIIDKIHNIGLILTVTHVLGHNGNEFNEEADKLAVSASQNNSSYKIDEEYENKLKNKKGR